jgi:hypothetical protein
MHRQVRTLIPFPESPILHAGLMCKDTVSVSWDGSIYDCDFNQQLAMPMRPPPNAAATARPTVFDIQGLGDVEGWGVVSDSHCYGCTAGSGSGCQGSTS